MDEEPLINLTPMIDVLFVVLVMFICIAPLIEMESVNLASLGGRDGTDVKEESPLKIVVTNENRLFLNKEPVERAHLCELLKVERTRFPSQVPQLFHDKDASFGTYQEVKTAVELAGFEQLDVVLN